MHEKERKRLDSWGEIAQYLRRDLTTVKRWEKQKGLPIHRLPGGKRQAVFAYQDEIDKWASSKDKKNAIAAPAASSTTAAPSTTDTVPSATSAISFLSRLKKAALGLLALLVIAVMAVIAMRHSAGSQLRVARYTQLTHGVRDKIGLPLFTDGARVYYMEKTPDGTALAAVAVAGGGTALVPCQCTNESIFDMSPQRSELLVGRPSSTADGELWVVPLLGGSPRRIGDVKGSAAHWSVDGHLLVFSLHEKLFVANADGSTVKVVAEIPGQVLWPRWSPDGKIIRFTENNYNNGETQESIWEVGADGSNLHRLLDGWNSPPHECCGVWTPDGKFYIFQSARDGRYDLWSISEEHSFLGHERTSPVLLSSGLQGGYSFPVMGINGEQIFAIGNQKQGELMRFDSQIQEFVPFLNGISATWVSFTKSGRAVAYIEYPDLTVWKANSDGSKKTQLTFSPVEVDGFSWSPDEKWLALRAHTPGKAWMIYLIPSEGGDMQLLISGEKEQGVPTWSADSKKIAFGDVSPVFDTTNETDSIHVVDMQNRTLSEIPGSRGLWTVRWSPDGHSLAALTMVGQRLMLYDFKTKKWRPTKAENVNNPTWSKDSQYIYFDTEGDNRTLRRIRVTDGHVDELASLRTYPNLAWWWSGVAPDNSPLILRNLDSHEIYALTLERH